MTNLFWVALIGIILMTLLAILSIIMISRK